MSCTCALLILDLNNFSPLQERNLHSGQRSGDLHRQGDGSEAATQRNQRRREARTANNPAATLVLDPPELLFRPRLAGSHGRRRRGLLLPVEFSYLYSSFYIDQKKKKVFFHYVLVTVNTNKFKTFTQHYLVIILLFRETALRCC